MTALSSKVVGRIQRKNRFCNNELHGMEMHTRQNENAVREPSSETQGQIVGARESLNGRKNMAQKKSKERREEPLGTMSYQTSSKRSPPFWLLIGPHYLPLGLRGCALSPNRRQGKRHAPGDL